MPPNITPIIGRRDVESMPAKESDPQNDSNSRVERVGLFIMGLLSILHKEAFGARPVLLLRPFE